MPEKVFSSQVLTDASPMPWGIHAGKRMIDVPAAYLLWLHDNNKCDRVVRDYIEDNLQVLQSQAKR